MPVGRALDVGGVDLGQRRHRGRLGERLEAVPRGRGRSRRRSRRACSRRCRAGTCRATSGSCRRIRCRCRSSSFLGHGAHCRGCRPRAPRAISATFTRAAARGLDLPALRLAFEPAQLRAVGRLGRPALARRHGHGLHQCVQARQRVGAVHLLAAVVLRLDDDHAVARDARVGQREQARLHGVGQRRGADVEAQVHRARHLVDVLPARALGADRGELDLVRVDDERRGLSAAERHCAACRCAASGRTCARQARCSARCAPTIRPTMMVPISPMASVPVARRVTRSQSAPAQRQSASRRLDRSARLIGHAHRHARRQRAHQLVADRAGGVRDLVDRQQRCRAGRGPRA